MNVTDWLLEPDDPSVRYRTLTELLDQRDTAEAAQARARIDASEPALKLLGAMHPDGYWLQKNPRTKEMLGDGTLYGSFGTTHFCLAYCAELGLDREHPAVAKAAERYLDLQQTDGDWYGHLSCLYAYNIRTFVRLGYRDDPRVQKAIALMLSVKRSDGGYLCDIHEKPGRRPPKSCVRGAAKALLAFSELPEYREHERCLQLADYFLRRNGIYKSTDHSRFVNNDMLRDAYPIIWRTNVWEILYGLSRLGYGRDPRLEDSWSVLERRKDPQAPWTLGWTPASCPWKVGTVGMPSKWVTLYCLLAEKFRDAAPARAT